MQLRDLGENAVIEQIRQRFDSGGARLGIGDDTAVIDVPTGFSLLYCSDLLTENVHFIRDLHPADSIGYKAVGVNVSDIGAMGGIPQFMTLSLALPGDVESTWLDGFLDGLSRACREFEVNLVGGDSSSSEHMFVDVSMIGWIETGREVRRSGARPGDGIFVTGSLGGSAAGLEKLRAGDFADPAVQKHLYPEPRHRVGRAVADRAHAMIDVSDGLSTDLRHILEESGVSARIDKNLIPRATGAADDHVFHGGEDYELLIVASSLPADLNGIAIVRIGEIVPAVNKPRILLIDAAGESELEPKGYQHFKRTEAPGS